MRVVMVGLDGSPASASACRWAACVAAKTNARLIAASAWRPQQSEGTPEDIAVRRSHAEGLLEADWSEPARALGVAPRSLLLDGPPDVLLVAAEDQRADLLVVGNRGEGGLPQMHLGSVAHHLAHHTVRPLAIVPAPAARDHPGTIVVGVDGSPGSAAAIAWCAAVAPALAAEVIAVLAFEPFLEWVPDSDARNWRRHLERHMEEWIQPLRIANVTVSTEIVRDVHPVAAIANTARGKAQLIVVGRHGAGRLPGPHLGSVGIHLVHQALLPVVLVPPPTGEQSPARCA